MTVARIPSYSQIEDIVSMGERAHAASASAQYKFNEQRAKLLVATLMAGKKTCVFVAMHNEVLVGFLLGQEDTYGYCDLRYATDIATYAELPGAGRILLRRFAQWAFDERKVDQVVLGVSNGGKSAKHTAALYKRMGYEYVGGIFTKNRSKS